MFTQFKHVKIGEQFTIRFPDSMGGEMQFRRTPVGRNISGNLYNVVNMDGRTAEFTDDIYVNVSEAQVERMKRWTSKGGSEAHTTGECIKHCGRKDSAEKEQSLFHLLRLLFTSSAPLSALQNTQRDNHHRKGSAMEKKRYMFTVVLDGVGETQEEAWRKALIGFLGLDESRFLQMTSEQIMDVKCEPIPTIKWKTPPPPRSLLLHMQCGVEVIFEAGLNLDWVYCPSVYLRQASLDGHTTSEFGIGNCS